jgi:hypothetical protein
MPTSTVADLVAALRSGPVLEAAQREELLGPLQERFACPRALADELRRRGWLSAFQADKLLQGQGGELVLGPTFWWSGSEPAAWARTSRPATRC